MEKTSSLLQSTGKDRTASFGGGVGPESIVVEIINGGNTTSSEGLAIQEIRTRVDRQIKRLYELGTFTYYMQAGYGEGTGSMKYAVIPSESSTRKLVESMCNICNESTISITSKSCSGVSSKVNYLGGYVQSVGSGIALEDWVVVDDISFTFIDVEFE